MKIRLHFFLLSLFIIKSNNIFCQLTTFSENWQERSFNTPSETISISEIFSNPDISIELNFDDTIAKVLPTHFGINFPHFLGDNILNNEEFINNVTNLSSMFFRIPGGSGSDRYFWDGNIPTEIKADAQITIDNLLSATDWRIGPDEYMNIIDNLNSNTVVVVNAGYARYGIEENSVNIAAKYAADFVRYLNNSLEKNIKYWEVGNELYGPWEAGHEVNGIKITGDEYGDIFNVFVDSMKSADPNIKIGAVCYPEDQSYDNWTKGVLEKVENTADFLIIHDYFKKKPNPNDVTYLEMLNSVVEVEQNVNNINEMVTNYTSKNSNYFPIAMTEFNSKSGEREISMANAIFITNVLADQIKNGYGMSLLWNIENGLGINGNDHGMLSRNSNILDDHMPRPNYYAYYLMQKYFGDIMTYSQSSDTSIISYSTKFSNNVFSFVILNTSNQTKIVELNYDDLMTDFYWDEIYSVNENDKKIYLNGQTNDYIEGGPLNYTSIASFHRKYNNNSKFLIKPYSITFIANTNNDFCILNGDVNCDGIVNLTDLSIIINNWLIESNDLQGDTNQDGIVNLTDLSAVINNWLQ
tara:strand:- start:58 stop:1803 length:1746 start_codon:yes stop_codon:yes gene_type:complete